MSRNHHHDTLGRISNRKPSRTYPPGRRCEYCHVVLSRYNPTDWCGAHQLDAPRRIPASRGRKKRDPVQDETPL